VTSGGILRNQSRSKGSREGSTMTYGPWDEYFVHQLPRTLDFVSDTEPSWSDRCYFNLHSPDGTMLLVTGYGNNPNSQTAHGYFKLALADGRHWDLDSVRRCSIDRGDLYAGPMRWTCVEPLKSWKLELGPNGSGLECELLYESRAPLWELLPMTIRKKGRTIADMQHIKQPGTYTGWLSVEGERISVDGFDGGRDRTFGTRVADQIDFWLWFEAGLEDRAIEAWVIESADGTVQYVDGGITFENGLQSKRFIKFEHDVTFDADRKRPMRADVVFTDEDGKKYVVAAESRHPDVGVYYGLGHSRVERADKVSYYSWDSTNPADLNEIETNTVALDQLMHFEMDDMTGHGIFELLVQGNRYDRYPTWGR
jgi:hypothetical protein